MEQLCPGLTEVQLNVLTTEGGNSRLACFDSTTGPILPLKTKVSYGQGGL